jgi:hypothetical protein
MDAVMPMVLSFAGRELLQLGWADKDAGPW